MRRPWSLLLLIALAAMSPVADRPAAAQDPDEPEEEAPAPPVRRRAVRISDAQIDRYVFGKDGDALTARRLCEARLRSRIAFIDQVCGIHRDQRKKLELAGRGDIKQFFDQVEGLRARIRLADDHIDRLRQLLLQARELGGAWQRQQLFGDESKLSKVLRTTLDLEQSANYQRRWQEGRLLRHHMFVELVCQTLQKNLALSDGERLGLLAVLLEETRPPRIPGRWDYYGILYQAARIPEDRLRPIFSQESDWRALRRVFDDARRHESMLRDSGALPEDRPDWDTARGHSPEGRGLPGGHVSTSLGRRGSRDSRLSPGEERAS